MRFQLHVSFFVYIALYVIQTLKMLKKIHVTQWRFKVWFIVRRIIMARIRHINI